MDIGARVEEHVDGVIPLVVDQTVPVKARTAMVAPMRVSGNLFDVPE